MRVDERQGRIDRWFKVLAMIALVIWFFAIASALTSNKPDWEPTCVGGQAYLLTGEVFTPWPQQDSACR